MKKYVVLGEVGVALLGAAALYYLLLLYASTNTIASTLISLLDSLLASTLGIGLKGGAASYALILTALILLRTVRTSFREGRCRGIVLASLFLYMLATLTHSPLITVQWLREPLRALTVSPNTYTEAHAIYTGLALVMTYVAAAQLESLYKIIAGLEEEGFPQRELGESLALSTIVGAGLLALSYGVVTAFWALQLPALPGIPEYYLACAAILLAVAGATTYLYVNPYLTIRRVSKELPYNPEEFYKAVTLREKIPVPVLDQHISYMEQYVKHTYALTHKLKHLEVIMAKNGTVLILTVEKPQTRTVVEAWIIYELRDNQYAITVAVKKPSRARKAWIVHSAETMGSLIKTARELAVELTEQYEAMRIEKMYDELHRYYVMNVVGGAATLEKDLQKLVRKGMSRNEAIAMLYNKYVARK